MSRRHLINFIFFLLAFLAANNLFAQNGNYYLGNTQYSFIKYKENAFNFTHGEKYFDSLIRKVDRISQGSPEQLRIVHLGGSHIQADMYTHLIRSRFQQLYPDMRGSRGLLFPYRIAGTNNPSNYIVSYTGTWDACKNIKRQDGCVLGLTGMAVTTSDSIASFGIKLRNDQEYYSDFDSIRIFHEPSSYKLNLLSGRDTLAGYYDTISGCTVFNLEFPQDEFRINLIRQDNSSSFSLLGISLDNDAPGVVYSAIGVNGARLSSFLDCELYAKHMQAIDPDLIIISIGTNDGYTRRFDKDRFYKEYIELLNRTRDAAPDAAILLTVPNDSYLYRRYANRNTEQIQSVIYRLSKIYDCAVWDFFTVMGGINSSQAWYSLGLMKGDRIHFTRAGYNIKGELFFSAFLTAWETKLVNNMTPEKEKK